MLLIHFLQEYPMVYLIFVAVVGLATGSFLNVVIYRLPLMIERDWQQQCRELDGNREPAELPLFNLNSPGSHCPQCKHRISPLENIPVISYLMLGGKCSECGTAISLRYPLVEITTAILSVIVAWYFGVSWQALGALVLTWALIALSLIDYDVQLLPDSITLPFIWLGLMLSLMGVFTDSHSAIVGAVAGYLVLWSVYQIFKRLTGKEGMGYGDFKLLALFGAWLGWQFLPQIILLSSLVGALIGMTLILLRGRDRNIPIPFGPYLAIAGWISLLWGNDINQAYLRWAGL
jgi:leader peptidase (prepilin peptidase)/N-methyltransferase